MSATMHVLIEVMAARLEGKLSILYLLGSFNWCLQKLVWSAGANEKVYSFVPVLVRTKDFNHLHV